ncbi:hypothetical protein GCM10023323_24270 [Streptomyces thinghirensis]|uniref:Uncharacterized protein n=1 Tax=Streptomyces thinghirensis TaxID=551547 RepID=A0ABP9T3D2_9ACTN
MLEQMADGDHASVVAVSAHDAGQVAFHRSVEVDAALSHQLSMAVAVNVLVMLPIRNLLSRCTGAWLFTLPMPLVSTVLPRASRTSARAPGAPSTVVSRRRTSRSRACSVAVADFAAVVVAVVPLRRAVVNKGTTVQRTSEQRLDDGPACLQPTPRAPDAPVVSAPAEPRGVT